MNIYTHSKYTHSKNWSAHALMHLSKNWSRLNDFFKRQSTVDCFFTKIIRSDLELFFWTNFCYSVNAPLVSLRIN